MQGHKKYIIHWTFILQGERKTAGRLVSLPRIVSLADVNLDQHQEASESGMYACESTTVGARFHSEALPATRLNSSLTDLVHTNRQVSFLNAADPRSSPVVWFHPLKCDILYQRSFGWTILGCNTWC